MPKAMLFYKLPEEREEHQDALNGTFYKGVLQEIDNIMRGMLKHEKLSKQTFDKVQELRETMNKLAEGKIWE